MSTEITTAFVQQYRANVDILHQQMGSRLRGAVREERVTGKEAFFDQIGATAMRARTTRHGDTPLVDTPHDRRKVTLVDYDWADLIDDLDKVKLLQDPASKYVMNAAMAAGRQIDDIILAAAVGTAYSGVAGATSNTFDTTNNRVAVASAGLTLAKVLEAKKILDGYDVDPSVPRYLVVGAAQIADLLAVEQATSRDYQNVLALAEGRINTFCGFTVIRSERLTTVSTGVRRCLAWAQTGITLAVGQDSTARVAERPDKNHAIQVYYSLSMGAVRMDEDLVVDILCQE